MNTTGTSDGLAPDGLALAGGFLAFAAFGGGAFSLDRAISRARVFA